MKKLIIAITLLLTSLAFAEHETPSKPPIEKFNFWWEQVPAVCSTSDEIERWAEFKKFNPINISFGRAGGVPDGEIVYVVVYWMNEDQESFASVSTPDSPNQQCVVFRTFDLRINEGLKEKEL